jgi:hypothetical protein
MTEETRVLTQVEGKLPADGTVEYKRNLASRAKVDEPMEPSYLAGPLEETIDDDSTEPGTNGSIPRPALLSGTSTEYMGRRPLPWAIRDRLVIVVMGPQGVGKSSVARRIAGANSVHLEEKALHAVTVQRVRHARWSDKLLTTPTLVLDGPVFLHVRPGATKALRELVRDRCDTGRKTIICEGSTRDGSISLLMDAVEPEKRATVMLRFPVGSGKRRFIRILCRNMGLDLCHVPSLVNIVPWSYAAVYMTAARIQGAQEGPSPTRGG